MPFLDEQPDGVTPRISGGFEPPAVEPSPPIGQTIKSTFERESDVFALVDVFGRENSFEPEEGYSAFTDKNLIGSKYLNNYGDAFVGVRSSREARNVQSRIDRELENAKIIDSSGALGTVAGLAAGVLSPTSLLPGGVIARGGSRMANFGRSAVSVAGAAAGGAAIQEGILQGTQLTREPLEAVVNVAVAAVLGGILGAAASQLPRNVAARVADDLSGKNPTPEIRMMPVSGAQSASAAASPAVDTRMVDRLGSGALAKFTAFMTPLSRMQTRDVAASRAAVAQLADPGGVRVMSNTAEGGFQPTIPGGSVEVRAKAQIDSLLGNYVQDMDQVYADYWKALGGLEGFAGKVGMVTNTVRQNLLGSDGPMTPRQFFERVGEAIRIDGAELADPFVKRAAALQKRYQDEVFALVPEDIRPDIGDVPKFAGGYLPRLFNAKAIAAKAAEFEETIYRNMLADQERKSVLQGDAQRLTEQMSLAEQEARKLESRRETLARQMDEAGARIAETQMAARRGQSRYEAARGRVFEMNTEISLMEGELAVAKESGKASAAELKAMESDLAIFRRARDKALKEAEKQPKEFKPDANIKNYVPSDMNPRRLLRYITGQNKQAPTLPKSAGFLNWVIAQGGINDTGGDVRSLFGGKPPKGLISENGVALDTLSQRFAETIGQENYITGGVGYRFEGKMLDYLDEAMQGRDPPGWAEAMYPEFAARLNEYELAMELRDAMQKAGFDPTDAKQVIAYLRGDETAAFPGQTAGMMDDPAYLESLVSDPIANFWGFDERAAAGQKAVKDIQADIAKLRKEILAREKVEARKTGSLDEAKVNARASKSRLDILLDRAERLAETDSRIAAELDRLSKERFATRDKLEKIVSDWEGETTRSARRALSKRAEMEAARNEAIQAGTYGQITSGPRAGQVSGKVPDRLTTADDEVDRAISSIIKSNRNLSDAELRTQAREVVMNMMASPDGRLPYEWGFAKDMGIGVNQTDADIPFLKERKFPVKDADMLAFLKNDVREVFHAYAHSMIPQAEMHRMFGDVRGTSALKAIQEEYSSKLAEAKSEADRMSIQKQMNEDMRDFAAMRDRILGVYALAADPESLFHRGANVARQMNFMSKMGMMVPNSLADAGSTILKHGIGGTFEAAGAAMKRMAGDQGAIPRVTQIEKQILDDAGVGLDYVLGTRQLSLSEIISDYGRSSKFERGVTTAANAFSYLNGARQWDTAMQTVAGVATLRRIMRNVEAWSSGTIARSEAEWMASINIGREQSKRIWSAALAGEGERVKDVLIPEGRTWADREAYDAVRFAIKQSVDSTIVKPGQDKPLWMSTSTGKILGQFRSFFIAAHQRILLSGLQQADANMAQGVVAMLALGGVSVALSDLIRDGKLKKNRTPGEWFVDSFDKSGIAGWLMEPNNIVEKISGQNVGLRPALGQEPATRTLNQSKLDIVFGPSVGFAGDVIRMAGAPFRGEITRSDIRAIRNQIPTQNLFWMRHVFNQLQDGVEKSLGIYEPPKRAN